MSGDRGLRPGLCLGRYDIRIVLQWTPIRLVLCYIQALFVISLSPIPTSLTFIKKLRV